MLEFDLPPVMLLGSSLQVNDNGTLRLNATSRSTSVAAGVVVQVADSATLELAGSASALSSGGLAANRAAIVNNSTASAGVLVSGTNQVVGPIDGTGNTEIRAGSDLTATRIVQSALVIRRHRGEPSDRDDRRFRFEWQSIERSRLGPKRAGEFRMAWLHEFDEFRHGGSRYSVGAPCIDPLSFAVHLDVAREFSRFGRWRWKQPFSGPVVARGGAFERAVGRSSRSAPSFFSGTRDVSAGKPSLTKCDDSVVCRRVEGMVFCGHLLH